MFLYKIGLVKFISLINFNRSSLVRKIYTFKKSPINCSFFNLKFEWHPKQNCDFYSKNEVYILFQHVHLHKNCNF